MSEKPLFELSNFSTENIEPEALAEELERIASQIRQGYVEGQSIIDERRGWWTSAARSE